MAIELITGMSGTPHISSDDVRAFNRVMFGAGNYVLEGCEAQITSPNNVHINPGELILGGGHSRITGTGENATIQNGAAGKVRTDAICVHYTRNAGGIESVAIQVVKGADVATGNVPVAPSGSGSMANNDSDVVTVLYLVDVTVSGVENLRKHESVGEKPNVTADVLPLSVENGGTGVTTLDEARKKLTSVPAWTFYEKANGTGATWEGTYSTSWANMWFERCDSSWSTGATTPDTKTAEYLDFTDLGVGKVTVLKSGIYKLRAQIHARQSDGRIGAGIYKNDNSISENMIPALNGSEITSSCECIERLSAGDVIQAKAYTNRKQVKLYNDKAFKNLSIMYLGE